MGTDTGGFSGGEGSRRSRGAQAAIVDRQGLPLSVGTHAPNEHEVTLVQLSFEFYMIGAKPEKLIGDSAYDRDRLELDAGRTSGRTVGLRADLQHS